MFSIKLGSSSKTLRDRVDNNQTMQVAIEGL